MESEPTVRVIDVRDRGDGSVMIRWHLAGGDLREDWRAQLRPGHVAWCECTVVLDADRAGAQVVAYGGEVWPSAWPSLFTVGPRSTYGQVTSLTGRGIALAVAAADAR